MVGLLTVRAMSLRHRLVASFAACLLAAGSAGAEAIEIYFTPGASHTGGSTSTMKTALLDFLGSATKTIEIAVYNLQDREVIEKLNTIAAAGAVTVRVIVDDNNYPVQTSDGTVSLSSSVSVKKDDLASAEMHHKFIIVDRALSTAAVWTGSANFNRPNFTTMNNNALILRSTSAASVFAAEFDKMWDGSYHTAKSVSTANSFTVAGVPVVVRMGPQDAPVTAMTSAVQAASSSAFFAVYTFGSSAAANAIINKKATWGSNFYGLFDEDQVRFNFSTQYATFVASGMTIATDPNSSDYLHHKFLVLDATTVFTGSANFTRSADELNDENALQITDAAVAKAYLAELARITGRTIAGVTAADWKESVLIGTATTAVTRTEPGRNSAVAISYPNPFVASSGGTVKIATSPEATIRSLRILSLDGRVVFQAAGSGTSFTWDGRNAQGRPLASGAYMLEIETLSSGRARGLITLVR